MTRRNPDRYTAQDWKFAGPTVGAIIASAGLYRVRPVRAAPSPSRRRGRADLKRIARERGSSFVLWGRATTCRRMGCPGRVTFWVRPHGASGDVAMT